jgi:transcriptional regulator with XRE-family HTH domain
MRYLGKTAKRVRKNLGLSQADMADELEISTVQLSKIENDRAMPSPRVIERYQRIANVDLYVLDWCDNPDLTALPQSVREAAAGLRDAWAKEMG